MTQNLSNTSRLLFKRVKICFPFFIITYNISYASFGEKNGMGCANFTLISVNYHYCAMWQSLFWASFLNRILFFKFYFKKVNVAIFSYFESNFIDKLIWGNVFFFFLFLVTWLFFPKQKFVFWPLFWKRIF